MKRGVLPALAGFALLSAAGLGALARVEPFVTWCYPLGWYGTLLLAEAALIARAGRRYLLARSRFAVSALAWSVPFWLTFELLNFRVRNWYYVFVPDDPLARWTGITISFATVIPAVLVSQRLLESFGAFEGRGGRPRSVPARLPAALQWLGVAMVVAALVRPRIFYPFVWGALTLLVDPWVYRRAPSRSLVGRLAAGRPALPLRLLAGGLAVGLLWELLNVRARGKWIYTVPGLEELKLFEMPLAGFLGFPVLALDAWAVWQALILLGLAADEPVLRTVDGAPSAAPGDATRRRKRAERGAPGASRWPGALPLRGRIAAVLLAAAGSAAVLAAMHDRTITSYTPRLEGVVGAQAPALEAAGHDVFSLAGAGPDEVAARAGVPRATAESWVETTRLAVLRGIGVRHALALREAGVATVEELAAADPEEVAVRLGRLPTVTPERVAVWVRAARGRP